MRFPPSLLDEIRARLPVSQVVARQVHAQAGGAGVQGALALQDGEDAVLHGQRPARASTTASPPASTATSSPSSMKTEGLSFPEAVERLAAGGRRAHAQGRARATSRSRTSARGSMSLLAASADVLREAARRTPGAGGAALPGEARARAREGIARFRLGYAPNSKSALKEHLAKAGFTAAEMAASGMLIAGDDIPVAYDRFRHRIMFPIIRPQGPGHRLRRAGAGPGCAGQVPELAGDAALSQGRGAVQRLQRPRARPRQGPDPRRGGLHGRDRACRWRASRRRWRRSAPRSPRTRSSCSGAWRPSRSCASTAMPPAARRPSGRSRRCCRT